MKNTIYIFLSFSMIIFSCIGEEHFGLSDSANILSIEFQNQNGNASIDRDHDSIYIEIANGADLSKIVLNKLTLSSFASSSVKVGDELDFTQGDVSIVITSESKKQTVWKVYAHEVGSNPQLPNSDFNQWYEHSGGYLEIGVDENSTIWGSSNPGVTFGGMDANVIQEQVNENDFAIKMITRYSSFNAVFKKPIASASAFTGYFDPDNININDPEAAIDFGTPFTAQPISFKVDYKYIPGTNNIDKDGNSLPYSDSCDIYGVLERREGETIKRVATAWLRTKGQGDNMNRIELDFVYGELPAGSPTYMLPKEGQTYAAPEETPTHINIVFASSANGANFQGAENSTLLVDNLELMYE